MTQHWEQTSKIDVDASTSAEVELNIDIPLMNFTVWAVSSNQVVDVDVQVFVAGPGDDPAKAIALNGVAATNFAATRTANIIWSHANPIALPRSSTKHPKKSSDPFKIIVRVTNNDTNPTSITIYAVGFSMVN